MSHGSICSFLAHKPFLLGCSVFLTVLVLYYVRPSNIDYKIEEDVAKVNELKEKVKNLTKVDHKLVDHIFKAKLKPHYNGKTIFFLETHLDKNNKNVFLTSRQACSIEASAKLHPDYDVYLIYAREVGYYNTTPLPLIDAIKSYPNVHIRHVDIFEYSDNTPLETWMHGGILFNSSNLLTHTSDILRILTLWRYTGTYLDLDVILRKRVDSIGPNFACVQKDSLINSAVSNLDSLLGRTIAEKIFEENILHFNPKGWTDNGPGMLTRVLHGMCNNTDIHKMNRAACKGFWVLPPEVCFEIDHSEHRMFFEEGKSDEVMRRIKDSFAVHFWNVLSGWIKLSTKSNAAYIRIAKESCPKVLKAAGDFLW